MDALRKILLQYAPECFIGDEIDPIALQHRLSSTENPNTTPITTGRLLLEHGPLEAKHQLLVGDNLEIMRSERKRFEKRFKCVYMDPPYNTGKQFLYNDQRSSIQEWLAFISPRLQLAHQYLRQDGLFFASIDDHAYAHLKLLCDQIFGNENYVTTFIWRRSGAGGLRKIFPVTTHEYILCYAKQKSCHSKPWHAPHSESSLNAFRWEDERGKYKRQALYHRTLAYREAQHYPITIPDGRKVYPPKEQGAWRYIKSRFLEEKNKNNICFIPSNRSPLRLEDGRPAPINIYTKQYLIAGQSNPSSLLNPALVGQTRAAKAELKSIFGSDLFQYAKPTKLLIHLFSLFPTEDGDLFLDMFAGSASMADAIHQLNPLLHTVSIQKPELCSPKSPAHEAGFMNIAALAWERICKTIPSTKARYRWQAKTEKK